MLVELSVMEQRYQAVLAVTQGGWQVSEVARRLGVSRQSVHAWIARYEQGGLPALIDRSHRPDSCPHQIAPELEGLICELRRQHPGWGPRRIEHQLGRQGVQPVPSRSSIYRCLRRHQLIELRRRRKRRDEFRRWERERPMQLWQMDVMGGVLLDNDTELKVVTGVDDHSRFCVAAGLVTRATSKAVCAVLATALSRYGIPDEILTDNGKVFTGRFGPQPVEVLFDRICRENGISHRHTAVRSPAMEIMRAKDTGTLQYDIYFNDDQSKCVVLERYRDSEAAIEHAANLGDLFGAVLATVSVVHGELLGEPSAELRAKLAGSEVPVLFTPYLSM